MVNKKYDLEERTFQFAKDCRLAIKRIKKNITNIPDCKQLIRSSGSVGANYIEANESLSKKDFIYRIKVCRKEAKESVYWLRLLLTDKTNQRNELEILKEEATELKKIFSAIINNSV